MKKYFHLASLIFALISTQFAYAQKIPCKDQINEEVKSVFAKATGFKIGGIWVSIDKDSLSQNDGSTEVKAIAQRNSSNGLNSEVAYSVQISPDSCTISVQQEGNIITEALGVCSMYNGNGDCSSDPSAVCAKFGTYYNLVKTETQCLKIGGSFSPGLGTLGAP